jgi:thiosulfate dehydrogenase
VPGARARPAPEGGRITPEHNTARALDQPGDRIVDCFLRSENATGRFASQADAETGEQNHQDADEALSPASKEVLAVSAYIAWLAKGYAVGANPAWRGQNAIASDKLVPLASLDRTHGETVFMERCTSCHGADGQASRWATRRPVRSGDRIRGTTAQARPASTHWQASSATRCPISIPVA